MQGIAILRPWRARHSQPRPRFPSRSPFGPACLLAALALALAAPHSRRGWTGAFLAPQRAHGDDEANTTPDTRVYLQTLTPNWSGDGRWLWYRNQLPRQCHEFVTVDLQRGLRRPAFDHSRLAAGLKAAGVGGQVSAERLPIDALRINESGRRVEILIDGQWWRCPLDSYRVTRAPTPPRETADAGPPNGRGELSRRPSAGGGAETHIAFVNRNATPLGLFWIDLEGQPRSYGAIPPRQTHRQHTFAGHVWELRDARGAVAIVSGSNRETAFEIRGRTVRQLRRLPSSSAPRGQSPDGRMQATVESHNITLRDADGKRHLLTRDGAVDASYGRLEWAPDSRTLTAWKTTRGEIGDVHLIESSPRGGGRAALHSRPYALPGDRFDSHQLRVFRVPDEGPPVPLEVEADPLDFGSPQLHWRADGARFTYEQVDRGHQRFRLIEVDTRSGDVRNLIDESSETFLWTQHARNVPITYLEESGEVLYPSERSGWRHLYLLNLNQPGPLRTVTSGDWVVRGIEWVDQESRRLCLRVSGKRADQDPYFIHYCCVDFDGGNLVDLTEGDGAHRLQFSPDRRHVIDTFSRVDLAPVHQLRRVRDGQLVCELERADDSKRRLSGWSPPEVFTAPGRDGATDIWGFIVRPRDFDPQRKYPVLEDIYAGPHDSHVPKAYSDQRRFADLTDRGFVVVKIDGMGTANRSKAFHDVCWKNLKDAGLPDRIAWLRAAAAERPYLDLDRVGIYGTSAGGQSAAAAVLFHGDFYKAAAASCGCHDNRLDKASWNEQWMGYPVGSHYAENSNIDNAHRLQGQLLLIVGEMDTNVPPESTMRLADALIRADKDFQLIVLPGAGHTDGGAYGRRRRAEFFERCLLAK